MITTSYSFACENVALVQQFTDQGDINSLTGFSAIRITQYLFLCVVVCPPLFVFSFSFLQLYCLSFLDSILLLLCHLQTFLNVLNGYYKQICTLTFKLFVTNKNSPNLGAPWECWYRSYSHSCRKEHSETFKQKALCFICLPVLTIT